MSLPPGLSRPRLISAQEPVKGLVRDLVHERTGVFFEAERFDTMLEKLEPLAVARKCQSYLDYYYILKYGEDSQDEWRRVMDAFSVQETYFWREFDQVRALIDHIIPAWSKNPVGPLRIWSAACASGEEPYSIAIAIEEAGLGGLPIEIIGSDASQAALAKAAIGRYRERSFRALPQGLRTKYFEAGPDDSQLSARIRSRVRFHWANLMQLDPLPQVDAVHVIFCRNVFIYFSSGSIRQVVNSFATRLPSDGKLFVGSSESLLKVTDKFDLQGLGDAFVYVKNGNR